MRLRPTPTSSARSSVDVLRAAALTIAIALLGAGVPAGAAAGPTLPLSHAGRWITDATGRVVVMHGTNMVYKLAPYYPAAAGFGNSDAAFLQGIGFNAVRVGVLWEALEPAPGVFNAGYVNQIANTVSTLARHGIVSVLDFHQDQYSEEFAGEGFPPWSIQDDTLTNTKTPFPGGYEGNPALRAAFENFWDDARGPGGVGLQERYATAWRYVAERFRDDVSVLGFEIMNEPFPGTDYLACASPAGCANSDAELTSFDDKVDSAIRSVDQRTLILYEPYATFNFGYQDKVSPLNDAEAVFAWHNYCLFESPCAGNTTDFQNAAQHIQRSGQAEFMTEFGVPTQPRTDELIVSLADQNMVSWTEWSYCTCGDPTGSAHEGIVVDPRRPKAKSNLDKSILDSIVEPYPQVISGTPRSWRYDRRRRMFTLTYSTSRASGSASFGTGSITQIATPALAYPTGYHAQIKGGTVVSVPGASVLEVATCPGATSVTVTVSPRARSSGSCRLQLRLQAGPARSIRGTRAHFALRSRRISGSYSAPIRGGRVTLAGHTDQLERTGDQRRF